MKENTISLSNQELLALSLEVRKNVFEICLAANSGHIGGASGAVELLIALYFGGILRYSVNSSDNQRDRVLIRGHLGPLRYKIFSLLDYINESELFDYRKYGSRLHGHEDHQETPGVDITPSGSLGMILSYGVGCAYAANYNESAYKTYVFLGDGEEQEGNISEAARHAAHLRLKNLVAVIDKNMKQLSNPTKETDSSNLQMIWKGYGWETVMLEDGHNITLIKQAYARANAVAQRTEKPVVIIANTNKGKGLEGHDSHFSGYHTISTCTPEVVESAIKKISLMTGSMVGFLTNAKKKILFKKEKRLIPDNQTGKIFTPVKLDIRPLLTTQPNPDACQLDYFRTLGNEAAKKRILIDPAFFLTADVTRKDHVEQLGLKQFCTFLNTGIREQHTIAMSHGLSLTLPESRIIINGLDAFTYRSLDQINAAVQGKSSMIIIGDVSGLTNSRNGKTHQTSGQPGALLMMPGITFLEPWDVNDVFNCLNWAIGESRGVVFIRIHSSNITPVQIPSDIRNINWYVVHDPIGEPDLTIIASGITVGSALEAAINLKKENVLARVINLINHKSLDQSFAKMISKQKPLLTVYNGHASVLQANVAKILLESYSNIPSKMIGLGFDFGTTGNLSELLNIYGLDAKGIVRIIKEKLI